MILTLGWKSEVSVSIVLHIQTQPNFDHFPAHGKKSIFEVA